MRKNFSFELYYNGPYLRLTTRNGMEVKVFSVSLLHEKPIVGVVSQDGKERVFQWFSDGSFLGRDENDFDLMIEYPDNKKETYAVWDERKKSFVNGTFYDNKQDAVDSFNPALRQYWKVVKINIEEI